MEPLEGVAVKEVHILAGVVLALVLLIAYAIYQAAYEWPRYRDAHHCHPSGKQRLRNTVMCHSDSKGMMHCMPTVRVDNGWLCDNGALWR